MAVCISRPSSVSSRHLDIIAGIASLNAEHAETALVAESHATSQMVHREGLPTSLLVHGVRYDLWQPPREVSGAQSPSLAKATLTRDSRRRWEMARLARRQGGLLKALAR